MSSLAIVVGGSEHAALALLVAAAERGARETGGSVSLLRAGAAAERALDADALLVAAPAPLYGLPADTKALFDGWLERIPRGDVVPRTSRMRAGYLCVHHPDLPELAEIFHRQVRGIFSFFGMGFLGRAGGFAPAGAAAPADPGQEAAAVRLGALLCGAEGVAAHPLEYLAGVERFNEGEFWEAHEAWEELWLEAARPEKPFFQGLIQVAAAFHHLGQENWNGMAALLDEGSAKLAGFRPRAHGLDLEAFLGALEPWRLLAAARLGRAAPVVRQPDALPRIELGDPGGR